MLFVNQWEILVTGNHKNAAINRRLLKLLSFLFIGSFVLTTACNGRTGLLIQSSNGQITTITNTVQTTGSCQCGACKVTPWCANDRDNTYNCDLDSAGHRPCPN